VTNPSEHRFHTPASKYIYNGGYHFNFLGGTQAIREKIKAYAHQEFNAPSVLDNVGMLLSRQKDALGRLYQYDIVPIDESYPRYIRENLDKFEDLIYKVDDGNS
jgi:beta-1,4-mannosyl-glycoprotein beta-1,4-N-acetylglucosaminyltransferase